MLTILSVGAGHETVLFWLANRVAKVVATDIYGEGAFGEQEADRTMLTDPASFSPYPYREQHLEVRHMDAKEARVPGRLVRRGLLALVDRALRLVGGHPPLGSGDRPRPSPRRSRIHRDRVLPRAQSGHAQRPGGR